MPAESVPVPVTDSPELADLKRQVRRTLRAHRDAHGGVPFGDAKRYWQMGYDEAKRAVLRDLMRGSEARRG